MARALLNKILLANAYRERAEELRAIAEGLSRDPERDLLITIANGYEQQAKSVEARARRTPPGKTSGESGESSVDDENSRLS